MLKPIYEYTSYREFLADWFAEKPARSTRSFAKRAGVSASLVAHTLTGRRDLAIPRTGQFSKAMNLSDREARYFRALVVFAHGDEQARQEALEEIFGARRIFHRDQTQTQTQLYRLFSRWYYGAILELARCQGFQSDPAWIADALFPNISVKEAEEAIEALLQLGLLVRTETGGLTPSEEGLATDHQLTEDMTSVASRAAHTAALDLGKSALDLCPQDRRHFASLTAALSPETLKEIIDQVDRFFEISISKVASPDNVPTGVYQLQLQLFPLSDPKSSGSSALLPSGVARSSR